MKEFNYIIKDEVGIHARPAGLLVKEVTAVAPAKVFITKGGRKVEANRLFTVMSLGVKCGDEITITVEGGDEEAVAKKISDFLENNL